MIFRGLTLVALVLASSLLAATGHSEVIRFAPLPLEDRKIIHEQYHGLTEYITNETGHQIELVHFSDYADIIQAFNEDKIDLVYLGPLPYILLKRQTRHHKPLVCFKDSEGQPYYTCSLVTFSDDEFDISSLNNAHVGLTQPYSTCGYLSVSHMLSLAGNSIKRQNIHYAGNHAKAALGVVRGDYDIAGVKTAIADRYLHLGLKKVATSERYPGFKLVANTKTISDAAAGDIQKALLKLNPQQLKTDRELMLSWGKQFRNGVISPEQCDDNNVIEALDRMPWPIPGAH